MAHKWTKSRSQSEASQARAVDLLIRKTERDYYRHGAVPIFSVDEDDVFFDPLDGNQIDLDTFSIPADITASAGLWSERTFSGAARELVAPEDLSAELRTAAYSYRIAEKRRMERCVAEFRLEQQREEARKAEKKANQRV